MSEDLAVSKLSKSLEQSKSKELQQIKKIEAESMAELAESLKTSLQTELRSIEEGMVKRLNNLQGKMTEARKKIIEDEKATLETLRTNREEIEDQSLSLMQSLNKIKLRYWLVPMIVGFSLIVGLTLGSYALGSWITSLFSDLQTVKAEVTKAEQSKKSLKAYAPISKIYKNGIEVKKGYKINAWQADNGLWFAEIKKGP